VNAGHVTFGSFNTSAKLNERTCALWARVALAVPGSRLVLKAHQFSDAPLCEHVRSLFVRHGLDPARVTLLPSDISPVDHLRAYERLDVALDPVPYNGTTTTCEALWMGVPVVTVPGEMHASRVGASLLTQVGLRELIAQDEDDYVRVAAALANDPARLAALRTGLRERMQGSALCDAPAHAERFGSALRSMWIAWCTGVPVGV
jgi:predicted O-linked N-acetylglucosamine transferase (SPINDLY family)